MSTISLTCGLLLLTISTFIGFITVLVSERIVIVLGGGWLLFICLVTFIVIRSFCLALSSIVVVFT